MANRLPDGLGTDHAKAQRREEGRERRKEDDREGNMGADR
jgi:hypothetical protein